ncbi:MAG: TlpA family protein disulfide reductase [Acidobacteria bacterium]|nr:TlpA family protein disulfide reductase [Acidobacteriota bacterium]MCB9396633.1 TlpA family protein disulfide reductase [Acidobacteriota bacterium]
MQFLLFLCLWQGSSSLEIRLNTAPDPQPLTFMFLSSSDFSGEVKRLPFETLSESRFKVQIPENSILLKVRIALAGYSSVNFAITDWSFGENILEVKPIRGFIDEKGPQVEIEGSLHPMKWVDGLWQLEWPTAETELTYMLKDQQNKAISLLLSEAEDFWKIYRRTQPAEEGKVIIQFDPKTYPFSDTPAKPQFKDIKGLSYFVLDKQVMEEFETIERVLVRPTPTWTDEEIAQVQVQYQKFQGQLEAIPNLANRVKLASKLNHFLPVPLRTKIYPTCFLKEDLLAFGQVDELAVFKDMFLFLAYCRAKGDCDLEAQKGQPEWALQFYLQHAAMLDEEESGQIAFMLYGLFTMWNRKDLAAQCYNYMQKTYPNSLAFKDLQEMADNRQAIGKELVLGELTDRSGKTVNLSHWQGKYLVLEIWASWCSGCVERQYLYEGFQNQLDANWGVFEQVCLDMNASEMDAYLKKYKLTGNQWANALSDRETFEKNLFQGVPALVILDPQGKIQHMSSCLSPDQILETLKVKFGDAALVKNL